MEPMSISMTAAMHAGMAAAASSDLLSKSPSSPVDRRHDDRGSPYGFVAHRAPIPEEEPIPGEEPEPEEDPVPHPDPVMRASFSQAPSAVAFAVLPEPA